MKIGLETEKLFKIKKLSKNLKKFSLKIQKSAEIFVNPQNLPN